jgi:Putative bacterial sensory transduction regulator
MKSLYRCVVVMFAAAALFSAKPVLAKNVVADLDQIAELMKGAGYRAELKGEKADRYLRSASSGYNFSIFTYGCNDDGTKCKSVQFYAGFNPKVSPTLEKMNEFGRDNRWGRYYLDKDGDPVIEFDLDLEQGGMSEELFLDNVEYWDYAMGRFADFVFK